jgi:RNA polymerase sigma-70 factor (ECF subfamily)
MSPISKAASIGILAPGTAEDTAVLHSQRELVAELQAGEEKAFELLVATYERPIVRFLYRYLGNFEEAKEVCQDVFLKVFCGISSFQNNCSLKTWIYRITLNTVLNEKRRWYQRLKDRFVGLEGISNHQMDSLPDPEFSLTMDERTRRVHLALRKLPAEYRAILVLRDLEGLSYQEIAVSLDLPLGTVKSRIARARQEMKNAVKDLF